jgi:hypothetical protein
MFFPFLFDVFQELFFIVKFHAASKILQQLYVGLAEPFKEIAEAFVFPFHRKELVIDS